MNFSVQFVSKSIRIHLFALFYFCVVTSLEGKGERFSHVKKFWFYFFVMQLWLYI